MARNLIIAVLIWNLQLLSIGAADDLDFIMDLPESKRPAHIASKLKEYASQFSSSVISLTATERGTVEAEASPKADSKGPVNIELVEGKLVNELVLSANIRYAKIHHIEGDATLITYDGTEGKLYGYGKNGTMEYVDHICKLPSLRSMSLEKFVELTGITTFNSCENSNLINKIESFSWGERKFDSTLGDCVILKTETRGDRLKLERNMMYFGIRDSFLVLLRYELMVQYQNESPINGAPAIIKYKWLNAYEYGLKSGKLLPESWTYLITNEYTDLEGRLLPLSNELSRNPNIIRSTVTTVSKPKLLEQFPTEIFNIAIDPKAGLVDSCQNAVQAVVAQKQKSRSWFSTLLLVLCLFSCSLAAYFYSRSRRS